MVFQLSYDLKGPSADYSALYEKIKSIGEYKAILQSTWLISTPTHNAEAITDMLSPLVKQGDRFFVSQIEKGKYNGWHSRDTWEWIRKQLQ